MALRLDVVIFATEVSETRDEKGAFSNDESRRETGWEPFSLFSIGERGA